MARPKKEGMDYFPHDTDASNEKKIEVLRMLYGNDGYAFYFILLEQIYQEPSFELDISDAETKQILCRKIAVSEEKFDLMLSTALKRELFNTNDYNKYGILSSNGIKKRANVVVEKRDKMRELYASRQSKVSDAETPTETPQSKEKESKEKESKALKEIADSQFIIFWNLYPNKHGKTNAQKKWNSYYPNLDFEKVMSGTQDYIDFCKATDRPFKDGSTFVNQKSWDEEWIIPTQTRNPNKNQGTSGKPILSIVKDGQKSLPLSDEKRAQMEEMARLLDGDSTGTDNRR